METSERRSRGARRGRRRVERHYPRGSFAAVRHQVQTNRGTQVRPCNGPLPDTSGGDSARCRPMLTGSSRRQSSTSRTTGLKPGPPRKRTPSRKTPCKRTSVDVEDLKVTSKKTCQDCPEPDAAGDAPVPPELAAICKKTSLDSAEADGTPDPTSKRTYVRTSKEALRKSEVSSRISEGYNGGSVIADNTKEKLKLKLTWADHKGGSLTSCRPLDVDAPLDPSNRHSHHPPPFPLPGRVDLVAAGFPRGPHWRKMRP